MAKEIVKTKDEVINELYESNKEMQTELARLGEAGLECAAVISVSDKHAILSNGIYAINNNYKPGQNVLVYPRTGQVVEVLLDIPLVGELFVLDKVLDNGYAELRVKGERKRVSTGSLKDLKIGDVVLLDNSNKIVQALIERVNTAPRISKPITWKDIGGNEEAKERLIEAIELPHKHPKLYKAYTQRNTKGILLKGPPGVGKTLLGKASATSIGSEDGFISIKGPEVLDPYVGVAEANIRSAFIKARAYKEVTGRPAVIFIDEAEALLTARGRQYNHMGQTIVPTFLIEMDGIDDSSAIVILSTNRDDMLDPAIIRDERIDFQVEVKRPDINEAKEIMIIHLNGKPIATKHNSMELIELATEELYLHTHLPFSGALLAGCVHKAVANALKRDIANNGNITGLSPVDFEWATQQIIKQEGKPKKEIQTTSANW